jgi:hypothetical protein
MIAVFFDSIFRGPFSKESLNLIQLKKMKVDGNPFLKDQNMVDAKLFKGKAKVLTSARAKEAGTVDLDMQISVDEYREIKRHRDQQKS